MKNSALVIVVVSLFVIGGVGMVLLSSSAEQEGVVSSEGVHPSASPIAHAVVYKSPTCGCCVGHAQAMREAGIAVETVDLSQADLFSLKEGFALSPEMMSCHTTVLTQGDKEYVVEGHVPIEGIVKLLDEQPDILGIFLPGMPIGTPGMPGLKTEPYLVMTLEEEPKLFVSL